MVHRLYGLHELRLLMKACLCGLKRLVGPLVGDVLQPILARVAVREVAACIPFGMIASSAVN